jgi:LuxR family maltose regulon positive regulatory protein
MIELATPTMRRARQEATLRRWLETLPGELFAARPVLSVALVGARMSTGDFTDVGALLDGADRWHDASGAPGQAPIVFDHDEFARLPAQIAIQRAGLALSSGDTEGTIAHATRALALTDASDHFRLGATAALIGLAHWSVGDLGEAGRRYADAVDRFSRAGFISDALGCSLGLADIQIALGRLGDGRRTYESALELADRSDVVRGTADMHVGLSEIELELGDLDAAAHHLNTAGALGEHAGLPQHPYRWRAATAHLRYAQGDVAGALELLDEAVAVYNTDYLPAIRPITAVRARVQLAGGDVAAAARWAADRHLTAEDDLTYLREYEHVTLARILLAQTRDLARLQGVVGFLDRLLIAAEAGQRQGTVIEILVLRSLGYEATGDRAAAVASLEQALSRAAPEGYIGVFLEAGPGSTALLRRAKFTGDAARHAQRVLAAWDARTSIRPGGASTAAHPDLVEPLSARELDVLRLLRSDLSGPEIARAMHVSLNTLRTHTKNIYTKLGATNRREAIRLAAEHGL